MRSNRCDPAYLRGRTLGSTLGPEGEGYGDGCVRYAFWTYASGDSAGTNFGGQTDDEETAPYRNYEDSRDTV